MRCVLSFKRLPVVLCIVLAVAIVIVPASAYYQTLDYTDLQGGDYQKIPLPSGSNPGDCLSKCSKDPACLGATYVEANIQGPDPVCYLKDKRWVVQRNTHTTSYIKVSMQQIGETDFYGGDISKCTFDGTLQGCSNCCLENPECVAATYVKPNTLSGPDPVCWIKHSGYDERRNLQTTSFKKISPSFESNPGGGGSWESCVPSFEATPLSGPVGMTVSFTDTSLASKSWNWNFDANDNGDYDSYGQNPTHTYTSPGVYSVELTIGCTQNINTITKSNLISVGDGSLAISSTPSGAAIYVDGAYKSVTPFTVTGLAPGDHTVRLTKVGYEEYSEPVTVTPGQTGSLSVPLVPQTSTTGSLSLTSTPSGARVTLDGSRSGTTPWVTDVATGTHSLVFSMTGYLDATATVTVQGGDTATYNAVLQKGTGSTTGGGSISVASVPSGATISLDGVPKGVTPTTLQGIPAGSHALALSLPGYETYRRNVDVTAGETSSYVANLIKTGSTTGVTSRVTDRVTDDWDDGDEDMPGFLGIGAISALAAAFLLVSHRKKR